MADVTQKNVAALCYESCTVLAEHPEGVHFRQVYDEVASRYPIPETLLEPNPKQPNERRFHNVIGWGTVDEVKAGWLVKDGYGMWKLTDEGRAAMDQYPSPGPFHAEATRLYREWDKRRKNKTSPDADLVTDGKQALAASSLEELVGRTNTSLSDLEEFGELLRSRRQLILEGPPGSGKTFIADAFGRYFSGNLLQGPRDEHMVVVQFHQSYGYEDFIQGIRPEVKAEQHNKGSQSVTSGEGHLAYVLKDGIFKELCDEAAKRPETEPFVILIDEINRGNISRIFGELLLLLEYRDDQVRLPYATADQPLFSIPRNVYILGTMNTADRSLAQIDYALRRRFYFYELSPVVDGQAPYLERWLSKQAFDESVKHEVAQLFLRLNERVKIELGEDFLIGHSYFMTPEIATEQGRERIWRRAILPLLGEYFYNRQNRDQLLNRFSLLQLTLESALLTDEDAVGA